jgi:dGTPase
LGLARDADAEHAWQRHPLAFLTEAADDVAYQILDLEDGLRLGHVSPALFQGLLGPLSGSRPPVDARGLDMHELLERAGRVRAVAISRLASEVVEAFAERLDDIVSGRFDDALIRHIPSRPEFEAIEETNVVQCYRADEVLRLELSGSVAIRGVLAVLVEAALGGRSFTSDRIRHLHQHVFGDDQPNESDYDRVLRVTDFVAGMTDHYVVRLYRELSGIRLPGGRD